MKLTEDIIIHDTLNPKIFNLETNTLLPKVKDRIIKIVAEFEKFIEIPIQICDIQLVGSNCSYNWHEKSDLDISIVANFEVIPADESIVQSYYWTQKERFNNKYNITIAGCKVELYVQSIKTGIISNGIYSVCDDEWVKEPKKITSIKKFDNSELLLKWTNKIKEVIVTKDHDQIVNALNRLYLLRHNSIAVDGEFGQGNQLYKDIRNAGLIDELKEALDRTVEKKLSLESLTKGQFIHQYHD